MSKTNGLRALDLAQLIVKEVVETVGCFPRGDPMELGGQLARAANSVSSNIAEGYGRATPAERRNKLRIARGELSEAQSHLKVGSLCKYLPKKRFYRLWNQMVTLDRMLARLMRR